MDTVYIALASEAYENDIIVGVYATAALAHKALAEFLADEPTMEGDVTTRYLHK